MIGQTKLLQTFAHTIETGLPRFVFIVGARGSGKDLTTRFVSTLLKADRVVVGHSVDDIRETIKTAYKVNKPTLYVLSNADKISASAKNALLKITEEPPRNAYFIMTLEDESNTLATLRSRASIFKMDPYTPDQLLEYAVKVKGYELTQEEQDIILEISNVPADIDLYYSYNLKEFYRYVRLVVERLGGVSGANAFKLTARLSFKQEDGLWDPELFLRACMVEYLIDGRKTYDKRCYESIKTTGKYINQLRIKGIHKLGVVDMWIMELRRVWR